MAVVHVPPGPEATRAAQELLAKAAAKGYDASVVQTQSEGLYGFSFVVPDDLIEAPDETPDPEPEPDAEPEPPKRRGRPKKDAKSTTDTEQEEV
jgi:hypothetical protein